jgi:Protein of unknown function (DUF1565)
MLQRLAGLLCTASVATFVFAGCGGDSFETAGGDTDAGADVTTEAGEDVTSEGGDVGPETSTGALQLAPTSHLFANVPPDTVSAPFPFVVTNTGQESTGAISVTTGTDQFQIVSNGCSGLEPTEECTIEVAFNPADETIVESTLVVSANPGGEATASLRGEPVTIVQEGIAIEPGVFDFGPVSPSSAETADLAVRNTGSIPLPAIDVRIDNTGTPVFQVLNNGCGGGLEPSDSCDVTIRYAPVESEPGLKTATLVAESGTSMGTALLSGHTPDLFVRPNGDDAADGLTFGSALATITHALDVAEPGWAVHLAQGTYGDAEHFPLRIEDVRVFGDNQPTIVAPQNPPEHIIEMVGDYPELHNVYIEVPQGSSEANPAVIVARPLIFASIGDTGINMGANWTGLETDVVQQAEIEAYSLQIECNNTSGMTRGIAVFGAAHAIFDSIMVNACRIGLGIDGTTTTVLRYSSFLGIQTDAVRVSSGDAYLDMGIWNGTESTSESGDNVFEGSVPSFTALNVEVPTTVFAFGNTWLRNVQGSDSEGHYPGGTQMVGPTSAASKAINFRLLNQSTFANL